MTADVIEIERVRSIACIWLNRPEVHNAFDAVLIEALTAAFRSLSIDDSVRLVILASRGRSFSGGADLQWMKAQGAASPAENRAGALRLSALFEAIANCPKPTLARVQGATMGGGVGLVAACDVAVGTTQAFFALTEVRLGLIPATIAPFVVRAIGTRQAKRYFQTAERIDAATAKAIGLLHEVVAPEALDARVEEITAALLAGAPQAMSEAKCLVEVVANRPVGSGLMEDMAERIAVRRASVEAAEGVGAFLEKRQAAWVKRP